MIPQGLLQGGHDHFLAHSEVYHRRVNLRVISAYTNHTYIHTVLVHTHMHIDGLAFDSKEVYSRGMCIAFLLILAFESLVLQRRKHVCMLLPQRRVKDTVSWIPDGLNKKGHYIHISTYLFRNIMMNQAFSQWNLCVDNEIILCQFLYEMLSRDKPFLTNCDTMSRGFRSRCPSKTSVFYLLSPVLHHQGV